MNYWELQVRLIDNTYDTLLDDTYCNPGDTTTFQSVAQPELSEEGKVYENELLSSVNISI